MSVYLGCSAPDNRAYSFIYHGKATGVAQVLSEYIQQRSESGNEEQADKSLRKLGWEYGLYITQMGEDNGNFNFAASIRPLDQDLPNIIYLNHIDVVPPGDTAAWTFPPFSGKIRCRSLGQGGI